MNRLKSLGSAFWIGLLAFLAAMSAAAVVRHKKDADKWKQRAEDEKEADVQAGTRKAQQHLTQAKLHESKAAQAKEAATAKIDAIGRKDETLADVVSGWSSD